MLALELLAASTIFGIILIHIATFDVFDASFCELKKNVLYLETSLAFRFRKDRQKISIRRVDITNVVLSKDTGGRMRHSFCASSV